MEALQIFLEIIIIREISPSKVDFPENTLCYVNQDTFSTAKGDFAIHLDYVILRQLIPAKNNPKNIDEYECKGNEVKLYIPLYDVNTGKFLGLDTHLAFIMVQGDAGKAFFLYGYDESKPNMLYPTSKKMMPNIFQQTCIKKHVSQILEEQSARDFSDIFFTCLLLLIVMKRSINL